MAAKAAVFLDRDGVINNHVRYVNGVNDFLMFPWAASAIARLNEAGFLVFVVTNQGGIGLGYMTEDALEEIHIKMHQELAKDGARIDEVVYCPHAPHTGCSCRKPSPAMILDLAARYHIDLKNSFMVGDRESDIMAGITADVRTILIGTGPTKANYVVGDLREAVEVVLEQAAYA